LEAWRRKLIWNSGTQELRKRMEERFGVYLLPVYIRVLRINTIQAYNHILIKNISLVFLSS